MNAEGCNASKDGTHSFHTEDGMCACGLCERCGKRWGKVHNCYPMNADGETPTESVEHGPTPRRIYRPADGETGRLESVAVWTASVLGDNGGVRDDGHWHAEHCPGAPAFPCHCVVIENEMSDYRMILNHCAVIYDIASGGRISKPNTLPSEVESCLNDRIQADYDEWFKEATEELRSQLTSAQEALRVTREQVGLRCPACKARHEAEIQSILKDAGEE